MDNEKFDESDIVARECRFVTHLPETNNRRDTHVINELVHLKDGRKIKRQKTVFDFQRPFWITKPHFRKHEQKHEWEHLDRLRQYKSTQSRLSATVAKLLGVRDTGLRRLANSPYLYGTDILSTSLIKKRYMDKYPDVFTPYTVATLDYETTVDDFQILMGTVSMDNKVVTAVRKDFVKGIDDPVRRVKEKMLQYIPDQELLKTLDVKVFIVETELDVIKKLFEYVIMWNPDWLAIWNIDFEVPVMMDTCERFNVNIADIVIPNTVPRKFRHFSYKQGIKFRKTDSGKFVPIAPQDRWHVVTATTSFYWIDAMCAYARIRTGEPKVPGGYGLDNILSRAINHRKIKFKEAEQYRGSDWHIFMQKHYPIEYIVYNQWDSISMVELDKSTKDLSTSFPTLAGFSDFSIFHSQPRRLMDEMHFYLLGRNKVVASSPSNHSELYKTLLGKDDWVITLPSHMIVDNGLKVFSDAPETRTNMRAHVYDNDAVSSYPSDTRAANVSNMTTRSELCSVEGFTKEVFMKQNINLVVGKVNAVEYCTTMFGFPSLPELRKLVKEKRNDLQVAP